MIKDGLRLSEDNDIYSFLMIGQSNMAGRGEIGEVEEINNDSCFMLRMGLWEKMSEPINPDAPIFREDFHSGISLAASFADTLSKRKNIKVGLIPCAVGGTKISQWMPGEILFDHAVMMATLSMRTSKLSGIIWHQGESDCGSDENVASYKSNFTTMISAMRKELGENLPVIMGELSENITDVWNVGDRPVRLNKIFQEIAEQLPFSGIAKSHNLTLKADGIHFDAKSCRSFGQRYAEEFLGVISKEW